MNVKFKAHAGQDSIVKLFARAKQKCNQCGKPIKPLFQPTRNPDDCLWLDCHTCLSLFCEDCCDVTAEGITECPLCYQARLVREGLRKGMCPTKHTNTFHETLNPLR